MPRTLSLCKHTLCKFSLCKISLLLTTLLLLCSCQNRQQTSQPTGPASSGPEKPAAQTAEVEQKGATESAGEQMLKMTSAGFAEGGMIPQKYTCDGTNVSPPLSWERVPGGTKTLALIADDPDAPRGTWVHWVLFNLPASVKELPENSSSQAQAATAGKQGMNDFKKTGYGGPCPPQGNPHRYFFKLYALDTELSLDQSATKDKLLAAMAGHVLADGQLMGKYQRTSDKTSEK